MGFIMRAAAWVLGIAAVIVAAFVVYSAFTTPEGEITIAEDKRMCPPQVSLAPRAPDAPVDDIAGLRPGFTVEDARLTLLCRDEKYNINFERVWHTPESTSVKTRQRMIATRSQERISLGIVGPNEREVVYAVFQDIAYAKTTVTTTPEAVVADLTSHYGKPHEDKAMRAQRDLWWLYDPLGKPVMPPPKQDGNPITAFTDWVAGSWDTDKCKKTVEIDPATLVRPNAECGLAVHAQIIFSAEDPTRITRYRIVLVDQARLATAVKLYRSQAGAASPTR
jgi:hypothetical protein